jgi:hypothetical protein
LLKNRVNAGLKYSFPGAFINQQNLKLMKRRNFIQSSATAGAGLLILPGYMQSIKGANDRLNIALIGAHGRASQLYQSY